MAISPPSFSSERWKGVELDELGDVAIVLMAVFSSSVLVIGFSCSLQLSVSVLE